jgi:mannose-6-phosphate isomerase-like protein (cupin superfamily)
VLDGGGTIEDLDSGVRHDFHAGQVVFVPPKVRHCVRADRGLRIETVGGPCPPDLAFLRASGAVPGGKSAHEDELL